MVLIIDDETNTGTQLQKLFRFAGLEAEWMGTALEALSGLHVMKPELIVLDLYMPVMDGMMFLREMRKEKGFKKIKVLMYTSEISREKEKEALDAGAQGFEVKGTLGWPELLARVRHMIGES